MIENWRQIQIFLNFDWFSIIFGSLAFWRTRRTYINIPLINLVFKFNTRFKAWKSIVRDCFSTHTKFKKHEYHTCPACINIKNHCLFIKEMDFNPYYVHWTQFYLQTRDPNNSGLYTLHQAKGDASAGNKKAGYLNKRSEGRLRNVWQRRRCIARDGFLEIYHGDETKPPTRVNLLTCQMKPVMEEELCFDVVSYNRTYHFKVSTVLHT